MNNILKYPGKELALFDQAKFWRKYVYLLTKKFFGKNILEVGAGIGSFTSNYYKEDSNITLTELDQNNLEILRKKFVSKRNILIENKFTNKFEKKFDTIIYMSVLEHIEHDVSEINIALSKLVSKGHLIILVPAHNYMYSQFDKEIGHFKRYEIDFFQNLKFSNSKIIKCFMTDTMGWILYYLNKIFYKNEKYPSKLKIFLWDKLFVPFTIILDFLTLYKMGKNIIVIIRKN